MKTVEPIGPKMFYGSSPDPREGLGTVKIEERCLEKKVDFFIFEIAPICTVKSAKV